MDSQDDLHYAAADFESADLSPLTHMHIANHPTEDIEKEKMNLKLFKEWSQVQIENSGPTGCVGCTDVEGLSRIANYLDVAFPAITHQDPAEKVRMMETAPLGAGEIARLNAERRCSVFLRGVGADSGRGPNQEEKPGGPDGLEDFT